MNHSLRPNPDVCKVLLSSPTKLQGHYSQKNLFIEPVFFNMMGSNSIENNLFDTLKTGVLIDGYHYMLVFNVIPENKESVIIPDYSFIGDYVSIALSVFFGKRFDNHGMIEGSGQFWMPHNQNAISFFPHAYYPAYSKDPRKDVNANLDLSKCGSIMNFTINPQNENIFRYFFKAAKFYLSSIKLIDTDLDKAYLDLITCGEILSSFYEYEDDELYGHDHELNNLLKKLAGYNFLSEEISFIKERLYQVSRKFSLTLKQLINQSFFKNTESRVDTAKLTEENIEKSIKAAYALRSQYVHGGFEFKDWIRVYAGSERQLSEVWSPDFTINVNHPNAKERKKLMKIIKEAPTYVGLERMMRFALLRFLHTNGVFIHSDLDS